jgi:hypothetical protein
MGKNRNYWNVFNAEYRIHYNKSRLKAQTRLLPVSICFMEGAKEHTTSRF